jgi:hypothetical protein
MGAFKSLTGQDIIVSPLTAYCDSIASGTPLKGKNVPYGDEDDETNPSPFPSASLIYASAKQLYYSNSLPNPEATFNTPLNVRRYDNFIQSSLYAPMNFPTAPGATISVVSIPKANFGDYIKPRSIFCAGAIDDGEGNMRSGGVNGPIVGRAIYSHGIIIFTDGRNGAPAIFQTTKVIYETQYKCTIRPDEFNYSCNPTILKTTRPTNPASADGQPTDLGGVVEDYVADNPGFAPYISAVGLYDSNNICLAVGKLALPIPTSRTTDMSIIVSLDR